MTVRSKTLFNRTSAVQLQYRGTSNFCLYMYCNTVGLGYSANCGLCLVLQLYMICVSTRNVFYHATTPEEGLVVHIMFIYALYYCDEGIV